MARDILVYGHADKSAKSFPTEANLVRYLKEELFDKEGGRYHYSQKKRADLIVVSCDGFAFGYLEVESMEYPNEKDRQAYPPVRQTYVISKSILYTNKVRLLDVGISRIQFGKYITEDEFSEIKRLAGGSEEFPRPR